MRFGVTLTVITIIIILGLVFFPRKYFENTETKVSELKPILENGSVKITNNCNFSTSENCITIKNVEKCLYSIKLEEPYNSNYDYTKCLKIQGEYSTFYDRVNVCLSIINQKMEEEKISCTEIKNSLDIQCNPIRKEIYSFNQYYENNPIVKCNVVSSEKTTAKIILKTNLKEIQVTKNLEKGNNGFELNFPLENDQNTDIKKQIQITVTTPKVTADTQVEIIVKPQKIIKWFDPKDEKQLVVGFSNPDDSLVQTLTARAKEFVPTRKLEGYLSGNMNQVKTEIKALFNAAKLTQISYVNDAIRFGNEGDSQKINTPRESILKKSANCIDGTILLSAMAESIGLEPVIVFMPGHSLIGIKLFPNASLQFNETYYLETTLISSATPIEANQVAEGVITKAGSNANFVDVKKTREKIKPFPFKNEPTVNIPTTDEKTLDEIRGKNIDEEFYVSSKRGKYYCFNSPTIYRVYNTVQIDSSLPVTFLYITRQGIGTFTSDGTFDFKQIENNQGCLRTDALTHYEGSCQTTNQYCLLIYYPGYDTAKVKIKHYTTFLD